MKVCDECGGKHYAKGKCKIHYKMPSQLNPKPIRRSNFSFGDTIKIGMFNPDGSIETVGEFPNTHLLPLTSELKKSNDSKPKVSSSTRKGDKSLPYLLKLAEIVFNKWIRNRDTDEHGKFICISCGERKDATEMDAGHYYPKTCSFLRFNENNVHGECQSCNRFHNDHLDAYAQNLIKKIGEVEVARLQCSFRNEKKWDREELLEIIKKYKL